MITIILLFLAGHSWFGASANIPFTSGSTDEVALLAFKAKITRDPYNILETNWKEGTSVCNWIGVTCGHKHRRVTALNLSSTGLKGTIAKEVGNLSFLVSLDISNNYFQGYIPEQLGNLKRLRGLYMQLNELSGQIPQTFGFLTRIQELVLYNNSLTGPIPPAILNLSSFQVIDLMYNFLEGTLPTDICNNLPNMESLNVSHNQLGGHIPASFSQCSEIKFLALSHNEFTGSIPGTFGNLSKLEQLYLGYNNLTGMNLDLFGTSFEHLEDNAYNDFFMKSIFVF